MNESEKPIEDSEEEKEQQEIDRNLRIAINKLMLAPLSNEVFLVGISELCETILHRKQYRQESVMASTFFNSMIERIEHLD